MMTTCFYTKTFVDIKLFFLIVKFFLNYEEDINFFLIINLQSFFFNNSSS